MSNDKITNEEKHRVLSKARVVDRLKSIKPEDAQSLSRVWDEIRQAVNDICRTNRGAFFHEATEAAGFELASATELDRELLAGLKSRLVDIHNYKKRMEERSALLSEHLGPVSAATGTGALRLQSEISDLSRRIATAESRRSEAVDRLISMNVPEAVAKTVAEPTAEDVLVMERELEAIKSRHADLISVSASLELQVYELWPELRPTKQLNGGDETVELISEAQQVVA